MNFSLIRYPSAWLPIAMSLAALTLVLAHIVVFGRAREADEGTATHLWQLLMAAQVPIIGFFAVKWLPRRSSEAMIVVLAQAVAIAAAIAPVFLLRL